MCNCINEKKIKEVCSNNSEQLRLELIDMIENNPPTKISKKALTSATEKEKKVKKAIDLYNDKYLKEEFTNCFHAAVTWLVEADKEWNKSR
ncbi:hypothetical protein BN1013_00836 [Candidatus Rubidus massiliensis]|nr:hypothetical protein BN1013_00836 [Candidatus Rubidus massiliensis]